MSVAQSAREEKEAVGSSEEEDGERRRWGPAGPQLRFSLRGAFRHPWRPDQWRRAEAADEGLEEELMVKRLHVPGRTD